MELPIFGPRISVLEASILGILEQQSLDALSIYYGLKGISNEISLGMLSLTLRDMQKVGLIDVSDPTNPNEKGEDDHLQFKPTEQGLAELKQFHSAPLRATQPTCLPVVNFWT